MALAALNYKSDILGYKNPWQYLTFPKDQIPNIDELERELVSKYSDGISGVRVQTPELIKLHIETYEHWHGLKKDNMTKDLCLLLARTDKTKSASIFLRDIECVDEEVRLESIRSDSDLKYISREKQTLKIILKSVSLFGLSRRWVSEKSHCLASKYEKVTFPPEKQKQIDLTSVEQNGLALEYVEEEHQDFEVIYSACDQNIEARKHIKGKLTPEEYGELYDLYIEKDVKLLEEVPKDYQTCDMILKAVKEDTRCMKHIKLELTLPEYNIFDCVCADKCGLYLESVPKDRQNLNLILIAVNRVKPEELFSHKTVTNFTKYIKIKLSKDDYEFIDLALIEKCPLLFKHTPKERQTLKVIKAAVTKDPKLREHVKAELDINQLHEINDICLQADGLTLEFIPYTQHTDYLISLALKQNKLACKFIDPDKISKMFISGCGFDL